MSLTITVRANGPYIIDLRQGGVQLTDREGNAVPLPDGATSIALCRCGSSANKPFCDGTHTRVGFVAQHSAE